METRIWEKFVGILKKVLEKPAYLIFIFIASVFVIISFTSQISQDNFDKVWIFFLYSVGGVVWRYIEKDIDSGIKKLLEDEKHKNKAEKDKKISHLVIIIIYHVGNIGLFLALLYYLRPI